MPAIRQPGVFASIFVMLFIGSLMIDGERANGQPIPPTTIGFPVFPRAEYYLGRELLRDGNTADAIPGFATTIRLSSQVANRRSIDSVPSLVMMGECYYLQGNLAAALEQFDAALKLSMASSAWLAGVQPTTYGGELSPPPSKGITWYTSTRSSRLPAYMNRWPIVLTVPGLFLAMPSGIVLPAGEIYTIDALEVLRTQALALRRRWMILGPLAPKIPLTQQLAKFYSNWPADLPIPLQGGLGVCKAYALLAAGDVAQAEALFQANVTIAEGLDHDTTPLALMGMADLVAQRGELQAAAKILLESTIVSARLTHYEHIAEAVQTLAAIAASQRDPTFIPIARQIAVWARKRSSLLIASSLEAIVEASLGMGDLVTAKAALNDATAIRSARDVMLPRIEAKFLHATALMAAVEGNAELAEKWTRQALATMVGANPMSTGFPRVYQMRAWALMLSNNTLDRQTALSLAPSLLAEPTEVDWQLDPLQCLAWLSTDKSSFLQQWLQLSLAKSDATSIAALVDAAQREQFLKNCVLGGRVQAARTFFHGDAGLLNGLGSKEALRLSTAYPDIVAAAEQMAQLVEWIRQGGLRFDMTRFSRDEQQRWRTLANMVNAQEARMWAMALSRDPYPIAFPPAFELEAIQKSLGDKDVVVCLFPTDDFIRGIRISKTDIASWQGMATRDFANNSKKLMDQIAAFDGDPQNNPEWGKRNWEATTDVLALGLFPGEVKRGLAGANRLLLVPTGSLWYFPFELLPIDAGKPDRWIAKRQIAYAPTLGSVLALLRPTQVKNSTILVSTEKGFFSTLDDQEHRRSVDSILATSPATMEIAVEKVTAQTLNSLRGRILPDRAVVAVKQSFGSPQTLAPLGYDIGPNRNSLSQWLNLPLAVPQEVANIGMAPAMSEMNGDDLFQAACVFLASGTKSVLLTRWPVRGNSSSIMLQRYLMELDFISASQALQRALFELWAAKLPVTNEPRLPARPGGAGGVVEGNLPFFWATYMQIGDTAPGK